MSNPDSFIGEVKEEVRRDRLYRLFRRYGWLGILAVLALVGGTAYREWSTANQRLEAEAVGDSILAASSEESPAERIARLDKIEIDNLDARAIRDFIVAAAMLDDGMQDNSLERLDLVSNNKDVSIVYRDLALLKSIAIRQDTDPPEDVVKELDGMIERDSEFRLLAMEMKAHNLERMGEVAEAISILRILRSESGVPREMSNRVAGFLAELEADS
ncbi:MAG: hypothetical protein J4F49_00280 [Rhodobacteraceae bacterium]|nr:hypothetical protein [Paracoccaceae bacterium]